MKKILLSVMSLTLFSMLHANEINNKDFIPPTFKPHKEKEKLPLGKSLEKKQKTAHTNKDSKISPKKRSYDTNISNQQKQYDKKSKKNINSVDNKSIKYNKELITSMINELKLNDSSVSISKKISNKIEQLSDFLLPIPKKYIKIGNKDYVYAYINTITVDQNQINKYFSDDEVKIEQILSLSKDDVLKPCSVGDIFYFWKIIKITKHKVIFENIKTNKKITKIF